MRLRNSFFALLGRTGSNVPDRVKERIRLAMLNALDVHCELDHARLDAAIQHAPDVGALWYLRPDLMHAISNHRGETAAHHVMDTITDLFRGHHPAAARRLPPTSACARSFTARRLG